MSKPKPKPMAAPPDDLKSTKALIYTYLVALLNIPHIEPITKGLISRAYNYCTDDDGPHVGLIFQVMQVIELQSPEPMPQVRFAAWEIKLLCNHYDVLLLEEARPEPSDPPNPKLVVEPKGDDSKRLKNAELRKSVRKSRPKTG